MNSNSDEQSKTDNLMGLWMISEEGAAPWWPKNEHGYPRIVYSLGHLELRLPGYATWCDEPDRPYWTQFALDLIKAKADRWLKQHEDELAWCPVEEAYISLTHGKDVFGESLCEILTYAMDSSKE